MLCMCVPKLSLIACVFVCVCLELRRNFIKSSSSYSHHHGFGREQLVKLINKTDKFPHIHTYATLLPPLLSYQAPNDQVFRISPCCNNNTCHYCRTVPSHLLTVLSAETNACSCAPTCFIMGRRRRPLHYFSHIPKQRGRRRKLVELLRAQLFSSTHWNPTRTV